MEPSRARGVSTAHHRKLATYALSLGVSGFRVVGLSCFRGLGVLVSRIRV